MSTTVYSADDRHSKHQLATCQGGCGGNVWSGGELGPPICDACAARMKAEPPAVKAKK